MRFDDMLATVLAREPERLSARIALWRQLLDLLAQERDGGDRTIARTAFDRLVAMRAEIPAAIRREAAASIAGRPVSPAMVALIAGDVPQVAGAMLARVQLADTDWLMLLPRLSPTARGFLRHRSDLGPHVEAALAGFGGSDMALGDTAHVGPDGQGGSIDTTGRSDGDATPREAEDNDAGASPDDGAGHTDAKAAADDAGRSVGPKAIRIVEDEPELPLTGGAPDIAEPFEPFEPGTGEGQIRAIISRISRFRSNREGGPLPTGMADPPAADHFHFETGTDGIIRWIEGVPRGPLIGETIAAPASAGFGVDAQAPGAFRARAPFRDARLLVAGQGGAAGEWRIAAVPVFAPATGRFLGYRGTGRRPRADERAEPPAAGPAATSAAGADSLRQLVHELRTPLNAIGGFAEMIRRQMRGPVSEAYRDRAGRIVDQAGQLLTAVDDLDVSARLDSARIDLQRLAIDVGSLLAPVCAELAEAARARGLALSYVVPADLPPVLGDGAAIRRMATRLLAAASGLASSREDVRLELGHAAGGPLTVRVTRPERLAGVSDAALFDPGYGPDGDWPDAPLLGLGFSLHLVRRLAAAAGGQLLVDDDWFTLRLPVVAETTDVGAG